MIVLIIESNTVKEVAYKDFAAMADPHAKLRAEIEQLETQVVDILARISPQTAKLQKAISKAQAKLAELNAEWEPIEEKTAQARKELADREHRTLGPWRSSYMYKWPSGYLYIAGAKQDWQTNRVWLRVVVREHRTPDRQWEVTVNGVGCVVLGPPTANPEGDFVHHKATVEDMCRKAGYFILPGETEDTRP